MSRARHYHTPTAILRHLKEGRGSDVTGIHLPWTETKDVPSHGRSHRLTSPKTDDLAHCHSDLERDCHFTGEPIKAVRKIRHQVVLDLPETLQISTENKLYHPKHPDTGFPFAMTTDQIWTVIESDGSTVEIPINVKYVAQRETRKNQEKRRIEEIYHVRRGRKLVDFDEHIISDDFIVNWGFIRVLLQPAYANKAREELATTIDRDFRNRVREQAPRQSALIRMINGATGVSASDALSALHHLIAHQTWPIDIFCGRLGPSHLYRFIEE